MDDKVTDIYTDTANALRDLIGMSPSTFSEVYQILRESFPQAQEAPKAASQSVENPRALARSILEVIIVAMESRPIARTGEILAANVFVLIDDFIKADRAVQRQAGREESSRYIEELECSISDLHNAFIGKDKRYAAVVEALKTARVRMESLALSFQSHGLMEQYERGLRCMYDADKALADLDEARKG